MNKCFLESFFDQYCLFESFCVSTTYCVFFYKNTILLGILAKVSREDMGNGATALVCVSTIEKCLVVCKNTPFHLVSLSVRPHEGK